MRRLTIFPFCMLMFGFVIGFGQPATAQDETADEAKTEQVAEAETTAANPEEEAENAEAAEAEEATPEPENAAEAADEEEANNPQAAEDEVAVAEAEPSAEAEPETDVPAATQNNVDDAAPSPSDVGGNVPPPPAPEPTPESEVSESDSAAQSAATDEAVVEGETAEGAVVDADGCCGPVVGEVYHAEPAPVCCQPAPVCCQPAPACWYPRQQTYYSSGGFRNHWMSR